MCALARRSCAELLCGGTIGTIGIWLLASGLLSFGAVKFTVGLSGKTLAPFDYYFKTNKSTELGQTLWRLSL